MSLKSYLSLAVIGAGLVIILAAATASVVRTDSRTAISDEASQASSPSVDWILPPVPIWPPL